MPTPRPGGKRPSKGERSRKVFIANRISRLEHLKHYHEAMLKQINAKFEYYEVSKSKKNC